MKNKRIAFTSLALAACALLTYTYDIGKTKQLQAENETLQQKNADIKPFNGQLQAKDSTKKELEGARQVMAEDFKLSQFIAGGCYSYILSSKKEALIIDPHISLLQEYSDYLNENKLTLKFIVDTHTHADYISSAAILKKKYAAPLLMHEKVISSIVDGRLKDGESINIGATTFKVIYTPGHTDDSISLYGEGRIFTADVLLIGSVGRTDFQNGSPESIFDTLQKLKSIPDDTMIFPGHDYHGKTSSIIAKEKTNNPFMKEGDKEAFTKNMRAKVLPKPFNIGNIIRVNREGEAVSIEAISPQEVSLLIAKSPQFKLMDVRSVSEFAQAHIKDSINVPMGTLFARIDELSKSKQGYIVICLLGARSPMVADILMQSGIRNVKVMEGGLMRWQKDGFPLVKKESGISLERPVKLINEVSY